MVRLLSVAHSSGSFVIERNFLMISSSLGSDVDVLNNDCEKDNMHNNVFNVFDGLQNWEMEFNKIFKP